MIDDKELITNFQNGDEIAFVSLYNRYKKQIYLYCFKMVKAEDAVKDIVQDVFLRVYENANKILKNESFKSWLFTIARNQCYTYMKKTNKFVRLDNEENEILFTNNPDEFDSDLKQIIRDSIGNLKDEYREAIVLREYLNYSYQEIAVMTGTTESAVKSKLFKARQQLHKILEPIINEGS